MNNDSQIILTADRTLMSNYHTKEFLGFATSAPPNVIPDEQFKWLFFPNIKNKKGIPYQTPYGLRKIEAKLINKGFKVLTVDPDHLKNYIENAKVLGISVMDPFGWGPSSTTFAKIMRTGDPFVAKYFRKLLEKPEVIDSKRNGLKIIVGGPGAWQFKYKPEFLEKYGIDCVINGEGEKIVPDIFSKALNGDELPQFVDVDIHQSPTLEEIPEIMNPSINGLIEIGRGCPRSCKFCSVTLRPIRWYPYEKIEKELKVNANFGLKHDILHAEDVLLYGSRTAIPEREKVLKLFELAKKYHNTVDLSHTSLAAIAADPKLIKSGSEILLQDQEWIGVQIGIETGSPDLIKKVMHAKAYPFEAEEWRDVVINAFGLMHDYNIVPACTLVTGLPDETEEDTLKTIELIDDLKQYRSLIVPLFFVPLGKLKDENWFEVEQVTELQKELLIRCLKHGLYWSRDIVKQYNRGAWYAPFMSYGLNMFINKIEKYAKEKNIL